MKTKLAVAIALVVVVLFSSSAVFAGTKTLLVKVEDFPAEGIRTYHLQKEVTSQAIENFESISETERPGGLYGGVPKHLELAKELFNIKGVTRVIFSHRYEVMIIKGKCFDWQKVEPEVIWTLKKYFGAKTVNVKKINL